MMSHLGGSQPDDGWGKEVRWVLSLHGLRFPARQTVRRNVTTPLRVTRVPLANWHRWIILFALLAAAGVGVFQLWRLDRDRARRQAALRVAEHSRFNEAEPLLLRVYQDHPDDAEVAKRLALGYMGANRLAEAEPYFARWCAARPGDLEPYKQRIGLWLRWNRLRDAADSFVSSGLAGCSPWVASRKPRTNVTACCERRRITPGCSCSRRACTNARVD